MKAFHLLPSILLKHSFRFYFHGPDANLAVPTQPGEPSTTSESGHQAECVSLVTMASIGIGNELTMMQIFESDSFRLCFSLISVSIESENATERTPKHRHRCADFEVLSDVAAEITVTSHQLTATSLTSEPVSNIRRAGLRHFRKPRKARRTS